MQTIRHLWKIFNLKKITLKTVRDSYNCQQAVRDSYNCREAVRDSYNCWEAFCDSYSCRKAFRNSYNCREPVRDSLLLKKIIFSKINGKLYLCHMSTLGHRSNELVTAAFYINKREKLFNSPSHTED